MRTLTLIFSKDRPLQLQATLASFALHCLEAAQSPITVLYRTSSEAFAQGYAQLQQEFQGRLLIDWVQERSFRHDLLACLRQPPAASRWRRILDRLRLRSWRASCEQLLFLVDDNIFVRPFSLHAIHGALDQQPSAIGFSLRVGHNTTRCYSMNCVQPLPDFQPVDGGLRFRWVGQTGDFGYPIEVSSSVYRLADLLGLLRTLPYTNPNRLEQVLSSSSSLFALVKPDLLCFDQSVAFCAPINKVQTILDNRAGESDDYSSEALLERFLDGQRVDVEALRDFVPQAAHVEIDLPLQATQAL
ncbi:hypothetical protein KBZ12_12060 [Cyanobium sp. Cruz CV13-4-11]|uniref:hypothetical protein n=1 Tax=unclassified Cyanobium TaxID=2627006 RepID=UPI0020CD31DC|nr:MULTISPECIES: hypothetical protein [unclassified Cyanobium]MCP9901181.1 hypothetical protein [Cyanobium sp. Cruz CV11-17]MCP9920199.1 hypothetical protein [Cyanobium sp. Cruz CV13-4-11]